jgi:imidazolonepropionase-like amidohydrolase
MNRIAALAIALCAMPLAPAHAQTGQFTVIAGGKSVGHVTAEQAGSTITVDFNVKNNGRGPTMAEVIALGADGLPVTWDIKGTTTFGSGVAEHFARTGDSATWTDATGTGSAKGKPHAIYVAQNGSPFADQIYARALLNSPDLSIEALPAGKLHLEKGETLTVTGTGGPLQVTRYTLSGIETTPETMLLDAQGDLFASLSPDSIIVRAGYEGEQVRLRKLAADWSTARYVAINRDVAHRFAAPVRIRHVHVFDPHTQALTALVAVVVHGTTIAGVEPDDSPATPGEVAIDGAGGTLIAGMYEMHAHLSQDDALLNLIAGVTTVRDMGNDNAVLARLIDRIDSGEIAGPDVIRSGFIEGKSPYSAQNGFVVDSEAAALNAVRWYGARGYWQIKSYNSMNPAWIPALVREAHRLGMRVAGHVPAFSTEDANIEAGFDEATHINQFALQWVIKPDEDTRTLFRLTALKRLPGLDLNSPRVQHSIDLMVSHKAAIDPTLGIHENLLLNRNGTIAPGAADYFTHMPIGVQRSLMQGWIDVSAPGDAQAYTRAYDKLIAVTRMLHDRGVFIVFGTDTGGSFTYHRELELYQKAGFTIPEILKRATYDSAVYVGEDQRKGSIEKGKLADFFLIPGDPTKDLKAIKTIAMVVKNGTIYFPQDVYPRFGITPFAPKPAVSLPAD